MYLGSAFLISILGNSHHHQVWQTLELGTCEGSKVGFFGNYEQFHPTGLWGVGCGLVKDEFENKWKSDFERPWVPA